MSRKKNTQPRHKPQNPPEALPPVSMLKLLNGAATNILPSLNTRYRMPDKISSSGAAVIEREAGKWEATLTKFTDLQGYRPSTQKLLDICALKFTEQNSKTSAKARNQVNLSLDEYLQLTGRSTKKPSKDKARQIVKEDLETLYNISLKWTENNWVDQKQKGQGKRPKPEPKKFGKTRICSTYAYNNGSIMLEFTPAFADYLSNSYCMDFSPELLKVDDRNSNAYAVGRKLLLHHSMKNNKAKHTNNVISVGALLDICPVMATPEETLSNNDRHVYRKSRNSLESALNGLPFISWEYIDKDKQPMPPEKLKGIDLNTYRGIYIRFSIVKALPGKSRGSQ